MVARPGAEDILTKYTQFLAASEEKKEGYPAHNEALGSIFGVSAVVGVMLMAAAACTGNSIVALLGMSVGVVFGLIAAYAILQGIPKPLYEFEQAVKRGDIIKLPRIVQQLWDAAVRPHRGIERWDRYPELRHEALLTILATAADDLQRLGDECDCGDPRRCLSVTHLSYASRNVLEERIGTVVKAAVDGVAEAFAAQLEAAHDERRQINLQIGGTTAETRPVPKRGFRWSIHFRKR